MKLHNPQVTVPAIGHVLIVGKNLMDHVSIDANVDAASCSVLPCAAYLMAAQNHTDVVVLAHKFGPH